jgi:hypothetical protein
MASKKLSTDTSLANSYKLSRGVASVARPSAPTIGTATDGGTGNMSVTFTASTLGPTASSFSLTSSSGVTGSGASSPLTLQEVATGTYTYSVSGVNANGTGPSSAASNSVVVASVFAPSGAYDSIATATGAASTITFSSIPSTYTHLQLRLFMVGTNATMDVWGRFNSDTGANYMSQRIYGTGSSSALAGANLTSTKVDFFAYSNNTQPACAVIDILDYANTSKYKTSRSLTGSDTNGSGFIEFTSGLWQSASAINSIVIFPQVGTFAAGTHAALYGIKGA